MYVCICNGYRESELRNVAQAGVDCALDAYNALGNGPCCGRCLDCAQQIIDQERQASAPLMAGA
jgi:bacterioferritin-associated ferredoxin